MERAYKITYAFVSEDGPIHSLATFIHSAIFSIAPWVCFCMSPSSRGHMLLHFNSMAELDFIVGMCPISHDGAHLSLEKSEASSNCFTIEQP